MPKKIQIDIKEELDFLEKSLAKTLGSLKQDRLAYSDETVHPIPGQTEQLFL